jgi:hypothetical protein
VLGRTGPVDAAEAAAQGLIEELIERERREELPEDALGLWE